MTLSSVNIVRASYLEMRNFTVTSSTYNRQGAQWITYRGIKMRQFFIRGADHVSYYDSEVGPNVSDDGMNWITAAYQTNDGSSDILFDGVRIHDFKKWNAGAHVDCIGIDDVDGLVIRNTTIWNCEHFSLIFGKDLWSFRAVAERPAREQLLRLLLLGLLLDRPRRRRGPDDDPLQLADPRSRLARRQRRQHHARLERDLEQQLGQLLEGHVALQRRRLGERMRRRRRPCPDELRRVARRPPPDRRARPRSTSATRPPTRRPTSTARPAAATAPTPAPTSAARDGQRRAAASGSGPRPSARAR